jgi:hypothetical protein
VVGVAGRATAHGTLELDGRGVPGVLPEAAAVALTIAIASVAGYATHTTFASRYIAVVVPLLLLVAAAGAARLPGRVVPLGVGAVVLALGAVGAGHNVVTDRTQAGQIVAAIDAGARPGDLVVICPDQLGPAVHRLLPGDLVPVTYPVSALGPDRVDWRDYDARNAASDPHAFARDVVARATGTHSVWVVSSGSYATLEGQCEAVLNDLSAQLGGGGVVVNEDGDTYFEHAQLTQIPVPPKP